MSAASPPAAQGVDAVRVGRGAALIAAGKGWFMVAGAAVNLGLGSLLSARDYGDYGVVTRWVSLLNMMVVQGMLQGVSRAVSRQPEAAQALRRQALTTLVLVGVAAAALLILLATPLSWLMGDGTLALPLMVAASITLSYAPYAGLVGVLNGTQRFAAQALTDMGFSTAKMVCILGAAALGLGLTGSVAGFGLSALVMALVAFTITRGPPGEAAAEPITPASLLRFSGVVMAYQALLNLLMFLDLGLVRRAAGLGVLSADSAGPYSAAVNLAQIPYLGCTAITFVVFPLLGQSSQALDAERSRDMVHKALRYALILIGPLVAMLVGAAPGVLRAVFPVGYLVAVEPLRLLALGYLATALASVICVILNAMGMPQWSALSSGAGVLLSGAVGLVLTDRLGPSGAALGSVLGMTVALMLSAHRLKQTGRGALPWRSLARHGAVILVVGALGLAVPWPVEGTVARVWGAAGAVALWLLALTLLIPLGELTRAELDLVRSVVRRRRA